MEECGVTYESNNILITHYAYAMRHSDARPHADNKILHVDGVKDSENVTTDVPGVDGFVSKNFFDSVEC